MADGRRLDDFTPDRTPHTNGAKTRRRRPLLTGVVFGFLVGALLATSVVPRVQWLNLPITGSPWRPAIAAAAAGMMVGQFRRDSFRLAILGGGIAALLSLWGVYGIVRLSVRVLFVERSITQVVLTDLGRLALYAVPAGLGGAAAGWWIREGVSGVVARVRARRDR